MKIIITGSEGNIGTKLVPYLRSCGHHVLRCDIIQHYASDYVKSDITNPIELYTAAYKFQPDIIFHMAGMVSRVTCEEAPALTVSTNITGTMNVIQLCRMVGAKLINFSTSEVYGNIDGWLDEERTDLKPNNRYGISKYLTEKLIEYEVKNGLRAVTVRPFMIYDADETKGEHRSAMIRFVENLYNKRKITVHENSMRSWLYIDDMVQALEKTIYLEDYHVINLGHPHQISAKSLAIRICKELKLDPDRYIKEVKQPQKMTLNKYPLLEKQKNLLNFEPKIGLAEGIRKVISNVRRV